MKKHIELINEALSSFLEDIDGIAFSVPITMLVISGSYQVARREYEEFVEQSCEKSERAGKTMLSIPREKVRTYEKLSRRLDQTQSALEIIPRTFLVSLMSQYDAYLGRLVRAIFTIQPEKLNASERTS